mgnify:CR=1 FL=1
MDILNEDDRIFQSWGTVNITDRQKELIPIGEFRKIMPVIMDRGGMIMNSHTNQPVGKILNYEFKMNPKYKEEGLLITGKVFDDYETDNKIWERVKEGFKDPEKKGAITGLSFGGKSYKADYDFSEKDEPTKILRGLEGFEFSLVETPANQGAVLTDVNMLAKGVEKAILSKEEIEKIDSIIERQDNPWAICHAQGLEGQKFEDCVRHVKEKLGYKEKAEEPRAREEYVHEPIPREERPKLVLENILDGFSAKIYGSDYNALSTASKRDVLEKMADKLEVDADFSKSEEIEKIENEVIEIRNKIKAHKENLALLKDVMSAFRGRIDDLSNLAGKRIYAKNKTLKYRSEKN